jgi:hypothetical protein
LLVGLIPDRVRHRIGAVAEPGQRLVDGAPALAVILGGQLRIVLRLIIKADRIAGIEAIADAERLSGFDLELLDR